MASRRWKWQTFSCHHHIYCENLVFCCQLWNYESLRLRDREFEFVLELSINCVAIWNIFFLTIAFSLRFSLKINCCRYSWSLFIIKIEHIAALEHFSTRTKNFLNYFLFLYWYYYYYYFCNFLGCFGSFQKLEIKDFNFCILSLVLNLLFGL